MHHPSLSPPVSPSVVPEDAYVIRNELLLERQRRSLLEKRLLQIESAFEGLESDNIRLKQDVEEERSRAVTTVAAHYNSLKATESRLDAAQQIIAQLREQEQAAQQRLYFVLQDNERWKGESARASQNAATDRASAAHAEQELKRLEESMKASEAAAAEAREHAAGLEQRLADASTAHQTQLDDLNRELEASRTLVGDLQEQCRAWEKVLEKHEQEAEARCALLAAEHAKQVSDLDEQLVRVTARADTTTEELRQLTEAQEAELGARKVSDLVSREKMLRLSGMQAQLQEWADLVESQYHAVEALAQAALVSAATADAEVECRRTASSVSLPSVHAPRLGQSGPPSSRGPPTPQAQGAFGALSSDVAQLQAQLAHTMSTLERERMASDELRASLRALHQSVRVGGAAEGGAADDAAGGPTSTSISSTQHVHGGISEYVRSSEVARLRSLLQAEIQRNKDLEASEAKLEKQLNTATSECASLNQECENLTATLHRLQGDLRSVAHHKAGSDSVSHSTILKLQASLEAQETELCELRSRCSMLSSVERQQENDLRVAADRIETLQRQVDQLLPRASMGSECTSLRDQLAEASKELAVARTACDRLERRVKELSDTTVPAVVHRQETTVLQSMIAEREARVNNLEARMRQEVETRQQLADATDALTAANSRLRELQLEAQHKKQLLDSAQSTHSAQVLSLHQQLEAQANEIAALRLHLQASQQRLLQVTLVGQQQQQTPSSQQLRAASLAQQQREADALEESARMRQDLDVVAQQLVHAAEHIEALTRERDSLREEVMQLQRQQAGAARQQQATMVARGRSPARLLA